MPVGQRIREGNVAVPGGSVWYRMIGVDAPGVPLLVLHGGPGAPHDYLENLAVLSDQQPVVFYDQLGCGRSERPEDRSLWTVERFVEELSVVREALGVRELFLLGQSWGAMLAVSYLLDAGIDGVHGVLLSGPMLCSRVWIEDQRHWLAQMPETLQQSVVLAEAQGGFESAEYLEAMEVYYRRHLCRCEPWPASLQRTFAGMGQHVYHTMWGPSEFTCVGSLLDVDLTPRLHELSVPVLCTCGYYDEARPETVAQFCRLMPKGRMMVFDNASHVHHLEQESLYLAALRDFFGQRS